MGVSRDIRQLGISVSYTFQFCAWLAGVTEKHQKYFISSHKMIAIAKLGAARWGCRPENKGMGEKARREKLELNAISITVMSKNHEYK